MLVISRRENQSFTAGNVRVIIVEATKCGKVKLGICAPPEVKILRDELQPFSQEKEVQPCSNQ